MAKGGPRSKLSYAFTPKAFKLFPEFAPLLTVLCTFMTFGGAFMVYSLMQKPDVTPFGSGTYREEKCNPAVAQKIYNPGGIAYQRNEELDKLRKEIGLK